MKARLPGLRVTPPTRTAESPPQLVSHQPDAALRPSLRLSPPAFHRANTTETAAERRPCGMEDLRPEEEEDEGEEEGVGYMMMSAQVSPGSSVPPDDYVVMVSPRKPGSSAVQTSVSR